LKGEAMNRSYEALVDDMTRWGPKALRRVIGHSRKFLMSASQYSDGKHG